MYTVNSRLIIAITIPTVLLFGCNKKDASVKKSEPMISAETIPLKPAFTAPDSFKVQLGTLYGNYLQITTSLAEDDFAKSQTSVKSVQAALSTLPSTLLDESGKAHLTEINSAMEPVLSAMVAAADIDGLRDHFKDLAPLVVDAMESYGTLNQGQAYLFHCPMANNNQGADWLQQDQAVMNPYFGKAMQKCGEMVREIKPMAKN